MNVIEAIREPFVVNGKWLIIKYIVNVRVICDWNEPLHRIAISPFLRSVCWFVFNALCLLEVTNRHVNARNICWNHSP